MAIITSYVNYSCVCVCLFSRAREDNMTGREQGRDRMDCDCSGSTDDGVSFTNTDGSLHIIASPKCIQSFVLIKGAKIEAGSHQTRDSRALDRLKEPVGEAFELLGGGLRFAGQTRVGLSQSAYFSLKRLSSILLAPQTVLERTDVLLELIHPALNQVVHR